MTASSSRQGKSRTWRFGSVEFAKQALSPSETQAVDAAAEKHGRGKIVSVAVESSSDSTAQDSRSNLIRSALPPCFWGLTG